MSVHGAARMGKDFSVILNNGHNILSLSELA